MPTCSVTGCLDRHEKKSGFSFYSFPFKNKIILEKWILYCNKEHSWIPKKSSKVCGRHFKEDCFQDRPDIRRLKDEVFPSVENFVNLTYNQVNSSSNAPDCDRAGIEVEVNNVPEEAIVADITSSNINYLLSCYLNYLCLFSIYLCRNQRIKCSKVQPS